MNVLDKIEKLRLDRGWSVYRLAEKAGITDNYIYFCILRIQSMEYFLLFYSNHPFLFLVQVFLFHIIKVLFFLLYPNSYSHLQIIQAFFFC